MRTSGRFRRRLHLLFAVAFVAATITGSGGIAVADEPCLPSVGCLDELPDLDDVPCLPVVGCITKAIELPDLPGPIDPGHPDSVCRSLELCDPTQPPDPGQTCSRYLALCRSLDPTEPPDPCAWSAALCECTSEDIAANPLGDADGDGLGNLFEANISSLLAGKGILFDPCNANSDRSETNPDDATPDGWDLVQGGDRQTLPAGRALTGGNTRRQGIDVSAQIDSFDQRPGGHYMDDPYGDGDPWLGADSYLGTGNLAPGAGGGARVAFESFMFDWHWHNRLYKERGTWHLIDPTTRTRRQITLSEDVRQWLNPMQMAPRFKGLDSASTKAPNISLALLALDHDSPHPLIPRVGMGEDQAWRSPSIGCDNEVYSSIPEDEPELENCGRAGSLLPKFNTLNIVVSLIGSPGNVADSANGVTAECPRTYGIQMCLTLRVHDDGRTLDPCTLAIATASFRRHHGLDGAPSGGILTALPPDLAGYCAR